MPKKHFGALPRTLRITRGGILLEGYLDTVFESDAPTHTHAKNITHTQQTKGIE
jgi:hypothetical protein